jgi:UMF1 family MFS transporter
MLSTVARDDEMDRLSTTAYAVGYLGGGLCLAFVLLLVQDPQWFGLGPREAAGNLPARIGFLVVAVWWLVFTIPFFRRVPEPPLSLERDERAGENPARVAVQRLGETFGALRQYKHAFLFLLAFLAFNDGIGTVIRMATLLGKQRSVPESVMMVCILLVQFVGIPFALLFGRLAGAIGPKRAILIALAVYGCISVLGYRLSTSGEFIAMAALVAMVQGGAQALSRSLFASLVPKHKSGEFFGLFSTLEKFAGVLGPLVFSLAPTTELAILSTAAFFALGAALLACVDVDAGRRAASEAERRLVRG